MSSADGVAIYHGNNGLRERADRLVQVEHIQAGNAIFVDVSADAFHFLVASRTKCFVPGPGKDDNTDVSAFTADIYRIQHFKISLRAKRIINFLTINGDFGNTFEKFKPDVFVFFNCGPFPFCHIRYIVLGLTKCNDKCT